MNKEELITFNGDDCCAGIHNPVTTTKSSVYNGIRRSVLSTIKSEHNHEWIQATDAFENDPTAGFSCPMAKFICKECGEEMIYTVDQLPTQKTKRMR